MLNQEDPEKMSRFLLPRAQQCLADLPGRPSASTTACLKPLIKFSQSFADTMHSAAVKSTSKPARSLVLPRAFAEKGLAQALDKASTSQTEIDRRLADLGRSLPSSARIFQFYSSVINNRSYLTVLPSEKEDVYVHAHVGDQGTYVVLRMNKKTESGEDIKPPTADFFEVDGKTLAANAINDSKCVSCHRTGTVAVLPKGGIFKSHTPGVSDQEMKTWWNTNRVTEMDISKVSFEHLGPMIGSIPEVTPSRNLAFVKNCASESIPNMTDAQAIKIRENMNCASCHSYGRGHVLRYPFHATNFEFTVFDNVILSGHMPLGSSDPGSKDRMTDKERKALLACLKAEYFGGFKSKAYSQNNEKPGILLKSLLNAPGCRVPSSSSSARKSSEGAK